MIISIFVLCVLCIIEPSLRFIGTTELSEGDASFITVQRQGESELPLSFQIEIDRGGTAMQGMDH